MVWDPARGSENITQNRRKSAWCMPNMALTESGGVVLFRTGARALPLSLLPESSIFVLRKSSILSRAWRSWRKNCIRKRAQAGERMPSCINIISGPSSTADIELIKVVGVHGPVKAVYLIIEDC